MTSVEAEKLHRFLLRVPEEKIRRRLIDPDKFSVIDARLALKIARVGDAEEFAQHWVREDFPQVRLDENEARSIASFWKRLRSRLREIGMMQEDSSAAMCLSMK